MARPISRVLSTSHHQLIHSVFNLLHASPVHPSQPVQRSNFPRPSKNGHQARRLTQVRAAHVDLKVGIKRHHSRSPVPSRLAADTYILLSSPPPCIRLCTKHTQQKKPPIRIALVRRLASVTHASDPSLTSSSAPAFPSPCALPGSSGSVPREG